MKAIATLMLTAALASAQINIPDGTKVRVRLDQTLTSATAEEGQTVELSVTDSIRVGDQALIAQGARVTGTITSTHEKRRLGRAGKLDFSIDRVRSADGEWVPLRYTLNKKNGESHAVRTGVITAGVAAVFWPAAPVFLLMKGKDVTINKGVIFDTFTDADHPVATLPVSSTSASASSPAAAPANKLSAGNASVTITSDNAGAEIEVDGAFVGSTPTTLNLASGPHQITVRRGISSWQRTLQVNTGSNISVNALLEEQRVASRRTQ